MESKKLYGYFKRQIGKILQEKIWTESFLMPAQNNAIRTNYIEAKRNKTQKNSKCWLCSEREEMINNISKCSKQTHRKNKTRYDCVGKAIHWELRKKFKFYHTTRWHRVKPESVYENETREIL